MKFKNLLPGICVALLIVSEFFLFSANRQKSAALAQLTASQQRAADLQSQLDEIKNSNADAENVDTRLRAENQDLPRLRNQIEQLQADNQKLSQQLNSTRDAAKQQQSQLQELQSENQQAAADAQAQAQLVEQAEVAQRNACINNLRQIFAAKQEWALEKNKTDADVPTEQDLLPYLKGGVFPVCPSGGIYTIGAVGVPPTCSITGHVLSQ